MPANAYTELFCDVLTAVENLNELFCENDTDDFPTPFEVCTNSSVFAVDFAGTRIWRSDEDERPIDSDGNYAVEIQDFLESRARAVVQVLANALGVDTSAGAGAGATAPAATTGVTGPALPPARKYRFTVEGCGEVVREYRFLEVCYRDYSWWASVPQGVTIPAGASRNYGSSIFSQVFLETLDRAEALLIVANTPYRDMASSSAPAAATGVTSLVPALAPMQVFNICGEIIHRDYHFVGLLTDSDAGYGVVLTLPDHPGIRTGYRSQVLDAAFIHYMDDLEAALRGLEKKAVATALTEVAKQFA